MDGCCLSTIPYHSSPITICMQNLTKNSMNKHSSYRLEMVRTVGRTDGRTDVRTDGRTDGHGKVYHNTPPLSVAGYNNNNPQGCQTLVLKESENFFFFFIGSWTKRVSYAFQVYYRSYPFRAYTEKWSGVNLWSVALE